MPTIKKILPPKKEEEVSSNGALKSFLKSEIHFNDTIPEEKIISSGSLILDSDVKVRTGMILRLVGKGSELGKTAQGLVFVENYLETMPKSRGIYVKAEGRLSRKKAEKSGLKFVYTLDEWIDGTVFVVCSNIAEPIFRMLLNTIKDAHELGEHIVWMIDSMDGLILEDDYKKGISQGMVAGVPKITKLAFRFMALPNAHYDALGIMTGQYSAQIKLDTYTPASPNQGSSSGGSSQQHQADYVFEYQPVNKADLILENDSAPPDKFKNKILGKFARIKILKSADDITGTSYSIPIRRGDEFKGANQIWRSKEIVDLLIAYEFVSKGGAWLSFEKDILEEAQKQGIALQEKINGINKMYAYLEAPENKLILDFLEKQVKELIEN